jgi:hypothetical protein
LGDPLESLDAAKIEEAGHILTAAYLVFLGSVALGAVIVKRRTG